MKTKSITIALGIVVLGVVVGLGVLQGAKKEQDDAMVEPENTQVKQLFLTDESCQNADGKLWNFAEGKVTGGSKEITVAIADTHAERSRGLGQCERLPDSTGMYFVFNPVGEPVFWMKDTLIPLDIIWIYQGKVVGVESQVPTQPDASDEDLIRYRPPSVVDGVLEVPAGLAEELGFTEGVEIRLEG